MKSTLSIWSIYDRIIRDFIQDAKKYFIIFAIQGGILLCLYLLSLLLIPRDIFVTVIQQQRSFITDIVLRQQLSHFSVLFVVLIVIFSKIIPFVFHVGLLNFIYILKTKSFSPSIQEFFSNITVKQLVRVFFLYAILLIFVSIVFLVVSIPFVLFYIFNISTTTLATLVSFLFLLLFVFPAITLLLRFFIASFIIFEPNMTIFDSIQESFYRTKKHGVHIALVWVVTLLIASISGIIVASPFVFYFGYPLKNLFSGDQASLFILSYLEQGYIVLASLLFVFFSYIFNTFWSIIFFLVNGEIYKRLTTTQKDQDLLA